jgi:aminoglycoside phosphotransferase (APT) family kinase protein
MVEWDVDLADCLPAHLRGPGTRIERIAQGMSGAGVYRVDTVGKSYVLKVATKEHVDEFRRKLEIRQLVAAAGVAPRVVHADEHHKSVLSEFIEDRGFPMLFHDPRTRASAIDKLGKALRAVHDITVPDELPESDPRGMLTMMWSGLAGFTVPSFVGDAVRAVLVEEVPESDRPTVLSHNDVNPTNIAYDGDRMVLLDWDSAGGNEPLFDLAAIAMFMRMDDATCKHLIAAHDGGPIHHLPPRFVYDRQLVAVLCGVGMLRAARLGGHAPTENDKPSTLVEFYQKLRTGAVSVGTPEGQWAFGLALVKASQH